jgi:hypothetical protein
LRRDRRRDPAPARVAKPLRCYAPEEFRHSTPARVVCRAPQDSYWNLAPESLAYSQVSSYRNPAGSYRNSSYRSTHEITHNDRNHLI